MFQPVIGIRRGNPVVGDTSYYPVTPAVATPSSMKGTFYSVGSPFYPYFLKLTTNHFSSYLRVHLRELLGDALLGEVLQDVRAGGMGEGLGEGRGVEQCDGAFRDALGVVLLRQEAVDLVGDDVGDAARTHRDNRHGTRIAIASQTTRPNGSFFAG